MERLKKDDDTLRSDLRSLYEQYGYRSFRMSKFEKYELYSRNKDFLVSDRVITFTDTNGDLMALKPDVTLSIVRSAEFRPGWKQRLYYQENVYRPTGSSRQFKEILQCGLECIGDLDSYDVWEVMTLARRSLKLIAEKNMLCFSHLGILQSLLRVLSAEDEDHDEILKLTAARSSHELEELFRRRGWDQTVLRDLQALLGLSCNVRELPERIRALDIRWIDPEIMRELDELSTLSVADEGVRFDFSVINDIHYYNGIVFQGFVPGLAEKVLSGGRYDSLMARMDRKGAAIGFAIYFGLLEQLRVPRADQADADVLLLYDAATPLTRLKETAEELRKQGLRVSAQRSTAGEGRFTEIRDIRGEKHD